MASGSGLKCPRMVMDLVLCIYAHTRKSLRLQPKISMRLGGQNTYEFDDMGDIYPTSFHGVDGCTGGTEPLRVYSNYVATMI